MRTDPGQAMVEFIIGIFALTLLISAFLVIGEVIPKVASSMSLVRFNAGRNALGGMGSASFGGGGPSTLMAHLDAGGAPYGTTPLSASTLRTETDVPDFAAEYLFGGAKFRTLETVYIPSTSLPQIRRSSQMEKIE